VNIEATPRTSTSAFAESGAETAASASNNIAAHLPRIARLSPSRVALRAPVRSMLSFGGGDQWKSITYAELDERSDAIARGLASRGVMPGDRAALLVRPGAEFVAITFALFKLGAVPVLVDPGMGRGALVACIARMKPRVFLGIPAAHALRALHRQALAGIEIAIVVGPRRFAGTPTLAEIASPGRFPPHAVHAHDEAAVLFTSGSTGPAKGVVYTHANFQAQVRALEELYGFAPGGIDLACFPLFALFSVALEMTAVFPRIDAAHPARCDPRDVAGAILAHGTTSTFGSPAIWKRVIPWCIENGVRFPTLERALIAGASVPLDLVESFRCILHADADVHTPYGATECLPVSSISGRELLELRARSESGAGTCIGRPAPGVEFALIAIDDAPIRAWSDVRLVAPGEPGEICVRADVATRAYKFDERATELAKIQDGASFWHRMGDIGYRDERGLLWFCGRKSQRIETERGQVLPVPSENVFNLHPRVRQTALVGVGARGREHPALVVEPVDGAMPRGAEEKRAFARELDDLVTKRARAPHDIALSRVETVLFKKRLPMDARHNAKIQREKLKAWAEGELE
jgi:acyl-CoA synthetase (AMP-forming)/AMP-acid ligase II